MIEVLIPITKGRIKTSIRGLWIDDNKKLYYDYIKIVNTSFIEARQLEKLKVKYSQQAIAYVDTSTGYLKIYYDKNKIEVLKNRFIKEVSKKDLKSNIRDLLKRFNGLTIYINKTNYTLECFYN